MKLRTALPAVALALCVGCNVPVVSPPQEGRAGGDLRQEQQAIKIEGREAVIKALTTMAAEITFGQKSGRSSSAQFGLVNVANQDVTSQLPAAGLAILVGLLWMKARRAQRHVWSLTKAIRAVHDDFPEAAPAIEIEHDKIARLAKQSVLKGLRQHLEKITRADGTEGDNERIVRRLKPRAPPSPP